jgi:hypothetical protein
VTRRETCFCGGRADVDDVCSGCGERLTFVALRDRYRDAAVSAMTRPCDSAQVERRADFAALMARTAAQYARKAHGVAVAHAERRRQPR